MNFGSYNIFCVFVFETNFDFMFQKSKNQDFWKFRAREPKYVVCKIIIRVHGRWVDLWEFSFDFYRILNPSQEKILQMEENYSKSKPGLHFRMIKNGLFWAIFNFTLKIFIGLELFLGIFERFFFFNFQIWLKLYEQFFFFKMDFLIKKFFSKKSKKNNFFVPGPPPFRSV